MGLTAGEAALVLMLAGDGTSGVQWFGSGLVDPFGTLPVPSNWRVDMLVKYCEYSLSRAFALPRRITYRWETQS